MKKNIIRITLIGLLSVTMISLSACGSNTSNETKTYNNNGLVIVSNQDISRTCGSLTIMYDPDTLVMYSVTIGGNGAATTTSPLFPLYNADGTLKTYTPNTESN